MRVAIIGGGPAGSFCAIQIIKLSGSVKHEVTIYDSKLFSTFGPPGCNLGAGVISRSMIEDLERHDIHIPPNIRQHKISGFSFYAEGGERHFEIPEESTFYSVFRGGGPKDRLAGEEESFDKAVLDHAISLGAGLVDVSIRDVDFPRSPADEFKLTDSVGCVYTADVLVGAFGVNSALGKYFARKEIGYRPPGSITAFQAELPVDAEFISSSFRNRIKVLCYSLPGINFVALTPKKGYVTMTVIGRHATRVDMEWVLKDRRILRHFPEGFVLPGSYCCCQPRMPITPAKNPYGDRFVIVGDAHVSRYYKNGIGSAFLTATFAAENIAAGKVNRKDFRDHYYRKCVDIYYRDNAYGKLVFLLNEYLSKSSFLSSVHLSVAEAESMKSARGENIFDTVLIDLFTGESPYTDIFFKLLSPGLQLAFLKHTFVKLKERIVG